MIYCVKTTEDHSNYCITNHLLVGVPLLAGVPKISEVAERVLTNICLLI